MNAASPDFLASRINDESVVQALKGGPLKNVEIRSLCLGFGNEDQDYSGSFTTEVLQRLKQKGLVVLRGNRWRWIEHETCDHCGGTGFVTKGSKR